MTTAPRHERVVSTAPVPKAAFDVLPELADREPNFEPVPFEEAVADPSWHTDRQLALVATEPPGAPIDDGAFVVARQALVDYETADTRLVRAVYDASAPFEGRDMVLVGRFLGLRFRMGVRVGGVVDEVEVTDDGPIHRFAWNYRTLEGHLEQGQMDYELTKVAATGEVHFAIRAYSRMAPIANPVVRWGFRVFGRREQLRFYDRTIERMRAIVDRRAAPSRSR